MVLGFKTKDKQGNQTNFPAKILKGSKIHSIREDKNNRWKAGRIIHFATGVRTKHYHQFKLDTCKSVQSIEIVWDETLDMLSIKIDGKKISNSDIMRLAYCDGFDHMKDFESWFKLPFKGQIIHWTRHIY